MHHKPSLSSNLVYVKNSLSNMEFLIYGFIVSTIPVPYEDNIDAATFCNLFALNLTEVKTNSKRNLTIDIGFSQRETKWNFIAVGTATAIIGADFSLCNKLVVDVGATRLI